MNETKQHGNPIQWPRPLAASFYGRKTETVARGLIGKILVHQTQTELVGGVIVETEAYLSANDTACHANRGPTQRNLTMFGPAGRLYVYSIHAKFCLNAVTEAAGKGSAVLIRALQPLWGVPSMQQQRNQREALRLCRGPAMLCQALGIGIEQDGTDITLPPGVWIGHAPRRIDGKQIGTSSRIGISRAQELKLRFFLKDCPFVSGPKKLNR